MTPSVVCYPAPSKSKSRLLCEAFALGSGGAVDVVPPDSLKDGPAAFYGTQGVEHLYRQARDRGGWYYLDNAFLDGARGTHFRVGQDALQTVLRPDHDRAKALGVKVSPWQRGRHVLVVLQSDYFMREVALWPGGVAAWQAEVLERLSTDRPIVVRHWQRDKAERARTLAGDMRGAWAVVGHTTAALNEALLAGIPVVATGACAAREFTSELEHIEDPTRPDGREEWAAALCASQWTVEEIAAGAAWRALRWGGATS